MHRVCIPGPAARFLYAGSGRLLSRTRPRGPRSGVTSGRRTDVGAPRRSGGTRTRSQDADDATGERAGRRLPGRIGVGAE